MEAFFLNWLIYMAFTLVFYMQCRNNKKAAARSDFRTRFAWESEESEAEAFYMRWVWSFVMKGFEVNSDINI